MKFELLNKPHNKLSLAVYYVVNNCLLIFFQKARFLPHGGFLEGGGYTVLDATRMERVIFSDELGFTRLNKSRRNFIWRECGFRYHPS